MSQLSDESFHRLLAISDEPSLADTLRRVLSGNGSAATQAPGGPAGEVVASSSLGRLVVGSAPDGDTGLELVRNGMVEDQPYSVAFITVDSENPSAGIKTAVRCWEADLDLQVIFCSAGSSPAWLESSWLLRHAGQFQFLRQAFDAVEVRSLTRSSLHRWHQQRLIRKLSAANEELRSELASLRSGDNGQDCDDTILTSTPAPASEPVPAREASVPPAACEGDETILLVDDDPAVLDCLGAQLTTHGYKVLAAGDSIGALEIWGQHRDTIGLLVTDLVMPGVMDGRQLADRLRSEKQGLKVILTTGYWGSDLGDELELNSEIQFLPKPVEFTSLLKLVRSR